MRRTWTLGQLNCLMVTIESLPDHQISQGMQCVNFTITKMAREAAHTSVTVTECEVVSKLPKMTRQN